MDDTLLDLIVERTVCLEGGHLVDLDQGWLELIINHYIEAEDLKTGAILYIIWLTGAEQMVDMWLCEA